MVNDINIIKGDEKHLNLKLKEDNLREESKRARELFKSLKFDKEFKDGLSFLDLKNDTLLSYMIDVCNIVLLKAKQRSILGHQSVARCVEYRVIIEKIRAIDQKLAYQINKLVSLPDQQEDNQKLDVKNLDVDLGTDAEGEDEDNDDDDDNEDEAALSGSDTGDQDDDLSVSSGGISDSKEADKMQKADKKKVGLYKAPKLRSVGSRKRAHDELYQDEDDDDQRDLYQDERRRRVDDDVTRYEEDNYTRLPEKKSKQRRELQKSKKQQLKGKKGRKKGPPRHKSS